MEKLKNIGIIFLLCTMFIGSFISLRLWSGQSGQSWFEEVFRPAKDVYIKTNNSETLKRGVVPYRISVVKQGHIYTESRITEKSGIYRDLETLLYEAMGSMKDALPCTETEYFQAYVDTAIIIRNSGLTPLNLYRVWADRAAEKGESTIAEMTLFKRAKAVMLGIYDESSDQYIVYQTAAAVSTFDAIVEQYAGDNAVYAKNIVPEAADTPYAVLGTQPQPASIYALHKGGHLIHQSNEKAFLNAVDINPYLSKSYQESSGAKVYVEDGNVLRTDMSGNLSYKAKEQGIPLTPDGAEPTESELEGLAVAKMLELFDIATQESDNLTIALESIETEQQQRVGRFFIKLDGAVIHSDEYNCGFVLKDGKINQLWLSLPGVAQMSEVQILSECDGALLMKNKHAVHFEMIYEQEGDFLMPKLGYLGEQ